ncbi:GyrI-like domain-containing protein [Herbiconiux sp. VKM Ac-1786]|uniref:GyrI-like domain-containing protein n=1 Tax=Herbiconiux sp. VKM Ac-1786 TaxID=2783824 RepID=UPI00188CD0CE|nr:GyrI-like domain-containing protein [Herbiconiux sp. VKM Ac-1786]MBF4571938.1 GyrI-like domain-containing protein [Herbiconiux sp. VKM Ac-1786]
MTSTHEVTMPETTVAGTRSTVSLADLPTFFASAFQRALGGLTRAGTLPIGPPITIYFRSCAGGIDLLAGFPVTKSPSAEAALTSVTVPAGQAVTAVHKGGYGSPGSTYAEISEWMHARELGEPGIMTEQYLVGPADDADSSAWRTLITYYLERATHPSPVDSTGDAP